MFITKKISGVFIRHQIFRNNNEGFNIYIDKEYKKKMLFFVLVYLKTLKYGIGCYGLMSTSIWENVETLSPRTSEARFMCIASDGNQSLKPSL